MSIEGVSGGIDLDDDIWRLDVKTRNKIRAILAPGASNSIELLNKLRQNRPPGEILKIERVLRGRSKIGTSILPAYFPSKPQTSEGYTRASKVELSKSIQMLEGSVKENFTKLSNLIHSLKKLDQHIVNRQWQRATSKVGKILNIYGYSHVLLRKAAVLGSLADKEEVLAEVSSLLIEAGVEENNVFATSLIHCYAEEHDFLSVKRSMLNLRKRAEANQFTRDVCRIPFHPWAKDKEDLSALLQSSLQSSLIDAVIMLKVNEEINPVENFSTLHLHKLLQQLSDSGPSIDEIAGLYSADDAEDEHSFYKRTSAWLENTDVANYKFVQDHFYDLPEGGYFELTPAVIDRVKRWVTNLPLAHLAHSKNLTLHQLPKLKKLEIAGTVTRSSLFNYLVHVCEGHVQISEADFLSLMGRTRDLAKTANHRHLRNLAGHAETKLAEYVVRVLVAKKSQNELDDHRLRNVLQQVVRDDFDGDLLKFFEALQSKSGVVARYSYEIFTEDFISKLFHLIDASFKIAETRASLHAWMAQVTGEKAYADRARTLLIDHQIAKIRNEIDDNRIFVDAARFAEWINDEILRDLYSVLTSLSHRNALDEIDAPQLLLILQRCYETFCSNKVFGIASYLGRRIRHGTFKGQLFSSVVAIEKSPKYQQLLSRPEVSAHWLRWKKQYESKIDDIIVHQLHVESATKKEGLLRPSSQLPEKQDVMLSCAKHILREFRELKTIVNPGAVLTEYFWRIAEIDLKAINVFLKNKRAKLVNYEALSELKELALPNTRLVAVEFHRDLNRQIEEKFNATLNWFKRPTIVAPRVSLSLLYKAVVAEVKESFHEFEPGTDFEPLNDIELVGGMYHLIYDSFYVIVYNAAKHGKTSEPIDREFSVVVSPDEKTKSVEMKITSTIKDCDSDEDVNAALTIKPGEDLSDAQVLEGRTGLRKLHQLQILDKHFSVRSIGCATRKVTVALTYALDY